MKDYDYITVYLPYVGAVARSDYSHHLAENVVEWLNENVGPGTVSYRHWLLEYNTDAYQWAYQGTAYDPDTNYTKITRAFCFRDIEKATLFKLVWGG